MSNNQPTQANQPKPATSQPDKGQGNAKPNETTQERDARLAAEKKRQSA